MVDTQLVVVSKRGVDKAYPGGAADAPSPQSFLSQCLAGESEELPEIAVAASALTAPLLSHVFKLVSDLEHTPRKPLWRGVRDEISTNDEFCLRRRGGR